MVVVVVRMVVMVEGCSFAVYRDNKRYHISDNRCNYRGLYFRMVWPQQRNSIGDILQTVGDGCEVGDPPERRGSWRDKSPET